MFVGRNSELEEFRQLLQKTQSSLVVCQGRRRIGKSTFIANCGREAAHFYSFEGIAPRPDIGKTEQLATFAERLHQQTHLPILEFESWPQAFQTLYATIPTDGWCVVALDEISWMAIGDKDFAGHLKVAWDNFFSKHPRLVMFLCGSVSSWLQENILNSTGFVGRCSWEFQMEPLPLDSCDAFWQNRKVAAAEKLKTLSVLGCIPRYLEEINPKQCSEQNIQRLCFQKGGLLYREFDQIFHDLFQHQTDQYREIVRCLVGSAKTNSEIAKALGIGKGGTLSQNLDNLESAGFIRKDCVFDPLTGKTRKRLHRFRLRDNYLRFYLKYIEPEEEAIAKGIYENSPLEALQAWDTIVGLQFENLVLDNLLPLLRFGGLKNVPIENIGPYFQRATQRKKACQIDTLVISRDSLYLFEFKFRKKVSYSVIEEIKEKIVRLKLPRDLTVRRGLIYGGGSLEPKVEQSDFFDLVISVDKFLEQS